MTTNDHSTSPDEHKITQIYQAGATEQPSSLVDAKILKQAKDALPRVKQSTNSEHTIRPKNWRKWQWSGSIAASVLLVSWLFMFNQPYYQQVDLVADEQYIESKAAAQVQDEDATRSRRLLIKPQIQIAESLNKTSAKNQRDGSLKELAMNDQLTTLIDEENGLAEKEALIKDIELSTPTTDKLAATKVEKTISILAERRDKKSADYQQLDKLLQEVLFYRKKMDLFQSKLNATQSNLSKQLGVLVETENENENSIRAKNTQVELFQLLLKYKRDDPRWSVPQKYLNVLNQQQLRELVNLSAPELHE